MKFLRGRRLWLIGGVFGYMLAALAISAVQNVGAAQNVPTTSQPGVTAFGGPTYSSPIALSADKNLIWVVNPDDDSVSVLGKLDTIPSVVGKVFVGNEPQSIALDTGNGSGSYHVYVANAADNTVTIINFTGIDINGFHASVVKTVTTGSEPWNIVASPDGQRVFVANSGQDTITVINTVTSPPTIIGSLDLHSTVCDPDPEHHFQPRGLAVTGDNKTLYVTRFLSFTSGATPLQGSDNGKVGLVCKVSINTAAPDINGSVTGFNAITLAPRDTGFTANINNVATPTKAYPNQMQSAVICGDNLYLPNIASSPSGPLRFDVDTQAFLNVVGVSTDVDKGALNLHLGARIPEAGKTKLFFANPWAMACDDANNPQSGYVVSAGSDLLVKVKLSTTDVPTFTVGVSTTRYIDLHDPNNTATSGQFAGKNPLGITIRNGKAYVMNYVSRNVSIVDLSTDSVTKVIATTSLPLAGSQDEVVQVGKEVFFSSRGVFDGGKVNRLSTNGWQNCASCHFAGLTDGNVWTFNAGPRKSVPLNGTFSPHNPNDQRLLNYSAIFDEVQDFEINIRNVSGPGPLPNTNPPQLDPNHGLLIGDNGDINAAPSVLNAFAKPNAGRPQLTITLPGSNVAVPSLDALNEWVRLGVRTPNGALTTAQLGANNTTGGLNPSDVSDGRTLFFQAGCQTCHGGTKWTNSSRDFTPPPATADIFTETNPAPTNGSNPVTAQYLDRFLSNIKSFNLNVAGQGNILPGAAAIGGVEKATDGKDALGIDYNGDGKGNGYNIPSLLGIFALPPYYHNGACETLACVLTDTNHRTAGLQQGQADPLADTTNQAKLLSFLKTLDAQTTFPTDLLVRSHDIFLDPPQPFAGTTVTVGANVTLFGTTADLANLAGSNPIKVKFTGPGLNSEVTLPVAAFNQDFGQAVVSTTWNVPNSVGFNVITVQVDSTGVIADNRLNDTAIRGVLILNQPADRTPPTVSNVAINNGNSITSSPNVKVTFKATDPTSPGGAQTSGVASFCVVRYYYSEPERRWVEQNCNFTPLPAPNSGTTDTFTVDATLPQKLGASYAFVWVKDNAGNISRTPGFDFINFIPNANVNNNLNRNDVLLFRVILNAGQTFTFNTATTAGDVDLSVFDQNGKLVASSTNSGTQSDQVTTPAAPADGTLFQIEARAITQSTFTIQGASALAEVESASVHPADEPKDQPTQPTVLGPPAQQTAIGNVFQQFIPMTIR